VCPGKNPKRLYQPSGLIRKKGLKNGEKAYMIRKMLLPAG
jgi:hypothetical protein